MAISSQKSFQTPAAKPIAGGGKSGAKNTAYTMQRRLSSNKVHEYTLITGLDFQKHGYRNREDITNLPPGVMVIGSYNVMTNVYGRIGVVKGYTLDGEPDPDFFPIISSFDFTKIQSNDRHLRSKSTFLQFRYVNPITGSISWETVYEGMTAGNSVNYTTYWDKTELTTVCLFVNQTSVIFRWGGAIASFASATSTTITKQGTGSWESLGFDSASGSNLFIDGIEYTYTGGSDTTTLTGVVPDPTLAGLSVGDAVPQGVTAIANSMMTDIASDFRNTLIGNLDNQIFIGADDSSVIYTSKVNDYTDYSSSAPRLQGEGNVATTLDFPNAFVNQDDNLYVSAGKDIWYQTLLTDTTSVTYPGGTSNPSVTTVYETLSYQRLKTTALQGAQSQSAVTKIKNHIAYLSFEPIVNTFGPVAGYLNASPGTSSNYQVEDISYSIVNDMNRYDFTGAAMLYHRQFLYISVPKEGLIRIYNMTNPKEQYWESPVTYPIARFSIIDDNVYGHSAVIGETYKLFDGYSFNGKAIPAAAYFSYEQYGTRTYPKDFNLFYLEGYITSNCTLNYGLNYDINGCQTSRSYTLDGNSSLVCTDTSGDASLGKAPLGSRPLSGLTIEGTVVTSTNTGLPPKFRAIKQLSKLPFYELQVFFTSSGTDQQWELLACGPNVGPATEGTNSIQY